MDQQYIQNKQMDTNEVPTEKDTQKVTDAIKQLILTMDEERRDTWLILQEKAARAAKIELETDKERFAQIAKHTCLEKKIGGVMEKNQRLKDCICAADQELQEVRQLYEESRAKARVEERKSKARIKDLDAEDRRLHTEYILLRTAVEKLETEYDELNKKFMLKDLKHQRENAMRRTLLQRKLTGLTLLEKKSYDQPAVNTPEGVLESDSQEADVLTTCDHE